MLNAPRVGPFRCRWKHECSPGQVVEAAVRDDEYLTSDFVVYIGEVDVASVSHLDPLEQSIDRVVFVAKLLAFFV